LDTAKVTTNVQQTNIARIISVLLDQDIVNTTTNAQETKYVLTVTAQPDPQDTA
jgi:predicted transcriptional regulator